MAINASKRMKVTSGSGTSRSDHLRPPTIRGGEGDEREGDMDSITMSQFASTIVVDGSPVRRLPGGVAGGRRRKKKGFRQLVATTTATLPVPTPRTPILIPTPRPMMTRERVERDDGDIDMDKDNQQQYCIQVVESQVEDSLNSQISEVSTQQSWTSTLRRGRSRSALVVPAGVLPSLDDDGGGIGTWRGSGRQQDPDVSMRVGKGQGTSGEVGVGGTGRIQGAGKSLLESFKAFKTKYDSKVRLFGHDLRNGKYEKVVSLNLVIRQVMERQDKIVKTIAYDLGESAYKWVIFKSADPFEITDGVCLKLFQPWQEISIEGNAERMLIGADFYKIFRYSDLNLTKQKLNEILNLPMPRPCEARASEPLFMDLVPYKMKNSRTIQKQIFRGKSYVDIDIVVLNVWRYSGSTFPVLCLVKDSDEFVTFLEIPTLFEDLASEVFPEKYFKLTGVAVHCKIKISEKLAPFSVIRLFGAKQSFFFTLKWESGSKWEAVTELDIPMSYPSVNVLNMDEIDMASTRLDCRITLKCKIKEKGCRHILVRDLDSDRSLMIDMVLESNFYLADIPLHINEKATLKFLRLIHGKAVWDHYTTCEELCESEELFIS